MEEIKDQGRCSEVIDLEKLEKSGSVEDNKKDLKTNGKQQLDQQLKFDQILKKSGKCFAYGALLKFLFALLQNRLNVVRVLQNPRSILKFGLMTFSLSFIFKVARLLIKKFEIKISIDQEVFLASILASAALFIADSRDLNLLKVMILPRAIESCYYLLKERGLVRPILHGDSILCAGTMVMVVYFYIHEEHSIDIGHKKTIDKYMSLSRSEQYLRQSFQKVRYNAIKEKYANNRLL